MKIVIVGGVAGGATAAARIRRNTEKAEIILLESTIKDLESRRQEIQKLNEQKS